MGIIHSKLDLYTLAGRGHVKAIEKKFNNNFNKAVSQMCYAQEHYPYFPVDVAFHNGAISVNHQLAGYLLLRYGSVYFSKLHTMTILNENIDSEYKLDYNTRLNTPSFMILCWERENANNIYKIHTAEELAKKLYDNRYEFPDINVMLKFCNSRLTVFNKELNYIQSSNDPFHKGRENFVLESIHIIKDIINMLNVC